jgi:hypothetical protein
MASIDGNAFELERRSIQLKYNTNMPDATILGYDGNPNNVVNGNNAGETLIYNVAQGATFLESNGNLWYKRSLPCEWIQIGGSTSSLNSTVVTKTIASGNTERFYTLDLDNNKNFEFVVDTTFDGSKSLSKHSVLYTGGEVLANEYSFLGGVFDYDITFTASGTDCLVDVANNEAAEIICSIKVETFNEI